MEILNQTKKGLAEKRQLQRGHQLYLVTSPQNFVKVINIRLTVEADFNLFVCIFQIRTRLATHGYTYRLFQRHKPLIRDN